MSNCEQQMESDFSINFKKKCRRSSEKRILGTRSQWIGCSRNGMTMTRAKS